MMIAHNKYNMPKEINLKEKKLKQMAQKSVHRNIKILMCNSSHKSTCEDLTNCSQVKRKFKANGIKGIITSLSYNSIKHEGGLMSLNENLIDYTPSHKLLNCGASGVSIWQYRWEMRR